MAVKEAKVKAVEELKDKFDRSSAVILTDYRGLNVADITELRRKLKEQGIEYKVAKNTLTRIAIKDFDYDLDEFLEGPTAMAFSYEDPVAPAKVLTDFAKIHKELEIKAGVVEGKVVSKDVISELAKMPPKEQLLASAVGAIQSPLYGIVGVMQGTLRNVVYTLQAIQDKKAS
ncbi:50S ribosomal protein L10 [Tepidanaerobacter acetatoxydans Re1]|uniref:Large ribosomal subunit protein uL10 n=1 Tax=Tepidanaerobacter acetatoxydans (strain DSM 21804 / JCM 16047 / Re1) TaxID=1209989 RepID=F4LRE5_TEPAE|nr:50S ribosomal protein L10 [Tepidanaerobacter acetatoxydans]AEE92281.1 50S ribosomal protein L10 [Tepidanaerobacter acetatoxydans Re1]CCP27158.1 50S ribosomal protein L10 [Tepidanaerobacter acetatoxydans Re1]